MIKNRIFNLKIALIFFLISFIAIFTISLPSPNIYLNSDIIGFLFLEDCKKNNNILNCKYINNLDNKLFKFCEYNYYGQLLDCAELELQKYGFINIKINMKIRKITIGK